MTTLEKIQRLERYLANFVPENEAAIDTAIDKLLNREELRLRQLLETLRAQISGFETQYKMSSDTFIRRFNSGELGDDMDYQEWSATVTMLANAERHLRHLRPEETEHESAH